jgi:hypothetical protein
LGLDIIIILAFILDDRGGDIASFGRGGRLTLGTPLQRQVILLQYIGEVQEGILFQSYIDEDSLKAGDNPSTRPL